MNCNNIPTLKIPISTDENPTYIKQGDTIPKIVFTFTDVAIDLETVGTEINMQVYYLGELIIDNSIGDGITVLSQNSFQIDEVSKEMNDYPFGTMIGDLEITLNGSRFTYMDVEYTVIKQYTKTP